MRNIDAIVIHGAWTPKSFDGGVDEVRKWHTDKGWSDVGYHFIIRRDGKTEDGRPVEKAGAHVKGHNSSTIGVCLIGGKDDVEVKGATTEMAKQELQWEFNYTSAQILSLILLVKRLKEEYDVTEVCGHRDFRGVTKRCPGFDVGAFFKS